MSDDQNHDVSGGGLPDLGGLLGGLGGGGGGIGDLFAQAQAAMGATQAASSQVVEGSAGGGVVRIEATAGGDPVAVHIDPAAVDPDDVEGLEDLVLAALRDVQVQAARVHAEAMGGFDPSAMLGGLLGGAGADEPDDEA
ncbi:MAG TPA: YbaB/EbfC family nucleoid-associated protein [Acidimicrobiales bacterium]